MNFVYEELCVFNSNIKKALAEIGAKSIELELVNDNDFFIVNGMRHLLTIKKRKINMPKKYIFIDSGYFGNFGRSIKYIRIIPNALHPKYLDVPKGNIVDFLRAEDAIRKTKYVSILNKRRKFRRSNGGILIPPSKKYAALYGVDVQSWTDEVIANYNDEFSERLLIRTKERSREERMVINPIWNDLENKRFLICYSSLTSIDALMYGIPFIDLGNGPIMHLSSTKEDIDNGYMHDQEFIIDTFNSLLFYQCPSANFAEKLYEIMSFYKYR